MNLSRSSSGDNIFHGRRTRSAAANAYHDQRRFSLSRIRFRTPSDYGVVEFDDTDRAISIEEKPANPKSRYAVPGLYFYDNQVIQIAKVVENPAHAVSWKSPRVNDAYLRDGELTVSVLDRGTAWLDTGTFASLVQAAEYVRGHRGTSGF